MHCAEKQFISKKYMIKLHIKLSRFISGDENIGLSKKALTHVQYLNNRHLGYERVYLPL